MTLWSVPRLRCNIVDEDSHPKTSKWDIMLFLKAFLTTAHYQLKVFLLLYPLCSSAEKHQDILDDLKVDLVYIIGIFNYSFDLSLLK